jgi:callose synthase
MIPFSVFNPYYSETIMYNMSELRKENEDGISVLFFYLEKIFRDEWKTFLERLGRDETTLDSELQDNSSDLLEFSM